MGLAVHAVHELFTKLPEMLLLHIVCVTVAVLFAEALKVEGDPATVEV
jgi:hypothetical protein